MCKHDDGCNAPEGECSGACMSQQKTDPFVDAQRKRLSRRAMQSRFHKMHQRCYKPSNKFYSNYGGRGIYVCNEWHSFEAYYAYWGDVPRGIEIDRIDNNGPYSPKNCRLATRSQQARNRRTSRVVEYNGFSMTIIEWSEKTGIDRKTIGHRLKHGWSIEDALTVPVKRNRHHLKSHKEESHAE